MTDHESSSPTYSRRDVLKLLGKGAVAVAALPLLQGCEDEDKVHPSKTPTSSPEMSPTTLPELQIKGDQFIADGKEIIMRGAVANHFVYKTPLEAFKQDTDWLKGNGANFVVVQWNSGYFDNPDYIEHLTQACEYAKSQRMRVELTLHSRGLKPGSEWDPRQLTTADEHIIDDWNTLLRNPVIASRLAGSVDIFNPLSEPLYTSLGETIKWKTWKPLAQSTIQQIRTALKKETAVAAVSGVNYGSDAWDVLYDPLEIPNTAVEIHPYQWFVEGQGIEYKSFIAAMKDSNMLSFVGEMGHDDSQLFLEDQYEFLVNNDVSFAVYSINRTSDYPNMLVGINGVTAKGELAKKYFKEDID